MLAEERLDFLGTKVRQNRGAGAHGGDPRLAGKCPDGRRAVGVLFHIVDGVCAPEGVERFDRGDTPRAPSFDVKFKHDGAGWKT